MEESERVVYEEIKRDFTTEIKVLDKGIDTISRCTYILVEKTPLLYKPNLNANLMSAKSKDQCSTVQILLLYNANISLRASRFLLLNGYPSPSLSCLRSTTESILNAHVCKQSVTQTRKWINCEKIERKGFRYPREMPESMVKQLNDVFNPQGAHANYLACTTQGYYPGIIFSEENRQEYEFFTLRHIFLSLFVSNRLLTYMLDKNPFLRKELPDTTNTTQDLLLKAKEIQARLRQDLVRLKRRK